MGMKISAKELSNFGKRFDFTKHGSGNNFSQSFCRVFGSRISEEQQIRILNIQTRTEVVAYLRESGIVSSPVTLTGGNRND
jgi:hypothetical protein